ncbi:acylhydrolase [Intrasporangium oryzae NRRL B-24470]|uniref:Acylhydrolase n=1 Tax=Intrasporangium oryzae NRRL B-24470 TaxID=1386089 RepID=W9GHC4_9MICO|nr:SGNH/GDSL hydrolase family protein [Intrasporangium oryzae]EWT03289.1 acylhydrolase [Intrasporangium oryzae NRRL B-24470]
MALQRNGRRRRPAIDLALVAAVVTMVVATLAAAVAFGVPARLVAMADRSLGAHSASVTWSTPSPAPPTSRSTSTTPESPSPTSPTTPTTPTTTGTGALDAQVVPGGSGPLQVVGLGDSVMSGANCDCRGIVAEYADALADATNRPVTGTNLGVPGDMTTDLADHLAHDADTRAAVAKADVVLVTIGANDVVPQRDTWMAQGCEQACYAPTVAAIGRQLAGVLATVRSLRNDQPTAVLVTDYWNVFTDGDVARATVGESGLRWSERLTSVVNRAICDAAASNAATCVHLVPPFKNDGDPTGLLAGDGDHPNAAGVAVIVKELMAATRTQG